MYERESESGTSLNFTIKRNTSYLVFILFPRVKLTSMFTHVKITRQWKSTLKDKTPHIGRVFSTYTPLTTSVWLCHRQPDKKSKKRVIYKGYFTFLRPLFYLLQNRLYLFAFFRRAKASAKQARSARHETRPTWEAPSPVERSLRACLCSPEKRESRLFSFVLS